MNELFDALSRAQRECLRLVAKGRKSKEIAKLTGFAPATIDTYLSKAAKTLGVNSRREAALLFDRWEAQQSGKPGFPVNAAVQGVDNPRRPKNSSLSEAADCIGGIQASISELVSLPPIGGKENDLNRSERLEAALKIAIFSAMALVAVALILREGLRAFS